MSKNQSKHWHQHIDSYMFIIMWCKKEVYYSSYPNSIMSRKIHHKSCNYDWRSFLMYIGIVENLLSTMLPATSMAFVTIAKNSMLLQWNPTVNNTDCPRPEIGQCCNISSQYKKIYKKIEYYSNHAFRWLVLLFLFVTHTFVTLITYICKYTW